MAPRGRWSLSILPEKGGSWAVKIQHYCEQEPEPELEPDAPRYAADCAVCGDRLYSAAGNWWHNTRKRDRSGAHSDLCEQHYWKQPRSQRKRYVKVAQAEHLRADVRSEYAYKTGGARVAVLCGGGTYERPRVGDWSGGPIIACDCPMAGFDPLVGLLEDAGFAVVRIDVDQLGSETGSQARSALATCRACVIPGGHDIPQAESLGKLGKEALEAFARQGGGFVGICAGAWLLGHGEGQAHNFRWLPVACDPQFGDNGLEATATIEATPEGLQLLGDGVQGQVYYNESPCMSAVSAGLELKVLAKYAPEIRAESFAGGAALERMGRDKVVKALAGGAAVVSGLCEEFPSRPRIVLIGPHWESTVGVGKHRVVARAVAWAAGQDPQ